MVRLFRRYSRNTRRYRKLSKGNIYLNRSAKSQARQIATLARKVNFVQKQCKPETKILLSELTSQELSNSPFYVSVKVPFPAAGTGDNQRIGNSIKFLNGSLHVGFDRMNTNNDISIAYRVIIIETKTPSPFSDSAPGLSDILVSTTNFRSSLISHFKTGITAQYKVLKDVVGSISGNNKIVKIKYNPYRYETVDASGNNRRIFFYLIANGDSSSVVQVEAQNKLAFTDA